MKILKNHAVTFLTFITIILTSAISAVPAEAYSSFTRTLSVGATDSSVSSLQTLLAAQQVYSGPITGYFGPQTQNGIKKLQTKYGLDPVGVVGPKTQALLNKLSSGGAVTQTVATAPTTVVAAAHTVVTAPAAVAAVAATTIVAGQNASAGNSSRTRTKSTVTPYSANAHKHQATTTPVVAAPTAPTASAPVVPAPAPVVVPPAPAPVVAPKPVVPPAPAPAPVVVPTPTPAPVVVPNPVSTGMQWGVFAGSGSPSVSSLASTLGKSPNIVATFTGWPDSFPTNYSSSCTNNQTLLIFWENYGYSVDSINAGTNDAYIKAFAQSAAASGCPVILSPFHEMNGNWDDWDGTVGNNSPAKLIAAWKHIHDIFVAAKATNVKFAWAMNSDSVPDVAGNQFSDYYPGDAYVDYVGVDGFNFGSPWQTFGQVFDSAIAKMQTYNKPIYIFSMGSVSGSLKAGWITEGLGAHVKTYANVKGWVYFNENSSGTNWLINSDAASLAAFKTVLP